MTTRHPAAARWRALALVMALVAGATAAWAQEVESPEDLPEGQGREETFYGCTACHGFALVRQQGMTRERWDDTIDYMTSRHNMPEFDAADRALILDYLAANFPPRQRGRPNPFVNR